MAVFLSRVVFVLVLNRLKCARRAVACDQPARRFDSRMRCIDVATRRPPGHAFCALRAQLCFVVGKTGAKTRPSGIDGRADRNSCVFLHDDSEPALPACGFPENRVS
jgi:hypothetical protein